MAEPRWRFNVFRTALTLRSSASDPNGANDFVFLARRGELVSNRSEDHEVSMLALHLLQNCMVHINTLMLPQVPAQPK